MGSWIDMTFRPDTDPEVAEEPDGTVEISFTTESEPRGVVTVLVPPDRARTLAERILAVIGSVR